MPERSQFVQQLLTRAALNRDAKEKAESREIVNKALPQMPDFSNPGISYNDMLIQTAYGQLPANQISAVPTFEKNKFISDIITRSIGKNILTGGRHPKADPIAPKDPTPSPTPTPTPTPTEPGPKLDPNATESFKTAFNAGNNNMDQIQAMYADRPDLQKWAKANPALAQKEYLKKAFNTDGTPKILDKTEEGFDKPNAPGVVESIDGMKLPNSININAANELLDNMSEADDNQAFLKNYIMAMQNN